MAVSLALPPLLSCLRVPQNSNTVDKILVSSAKNNFVACLEGFKSVTCEKKKAVQELFENEVLSGR